MGDYLATPIKEKETDEGENGRVSTSQSSLSTSL